MNNFHKNFNFFLRICRQPSHWKRHWQPVCCSHNINASASLKLTSEAMPPIGHTRYAPTLTVGVDADSRRSAAAKFDSARGRQNAKAVVGRTYWGEAVNHRWRQKCNRLAYPVKVHCSPSLTNKTVRNQLQWRRHWATVVLLIFGVAVELKLSQLHYYLVYYRTS